MSGKIDERLPKDVGMGVCPAYSGVKTPWDKIISYKDAMHYISRYNAVFSAAIMQAWKIMTPGSYEKRAQLICEASYDLLYNSVASSSDDMMFGAINVHPFCRGGFVAALAGDQGDEQLLMCGRVNDFGTYRVEKELDVCDWDIVGTELCRATTMSLQAGADNRQKRLRKGPALDYAMVEAKGAGDRHCRIVAENREKFPMPEHEFWESFGPVATADQIKFTKEEDCVKESQIFREDADFRYESGTHDVQTTQSASMNQYCCAASVYLFNVINETIKRGLVTDEFANHVLKCVCEAAGKAYWGDQVAKEAHRLWMGVPREIPENDGRVMGGHIEVYLSAMGIDYTVVAFNKNEVILDLDRSRLSLGNAKTVDCLISYWYGMCKTLVSAEWAVWEEPEDTSPERLRLKIARKIDKFC